MELYYKYIETQKSEYFFHVYWVKHNGFGLPKLKINDREKHSVNYVTIFDFKCYKLYVYLVKGRNCRDICR